MPPAACRRTALRPLLGDIGGQAFPGREQFLFVHNVVAIEHGPRFVPGQQHRDPLLAEAPRSEGERIGRGAVEQVRVIHDGQDRVTLQRTAATPGRPSEEVLMATSRSKSQVAVPGWTSAGPGCFFSWAVERAGL